MIEWRWPCRSAKRRRTQIGANEAAPD